MKKIKVLAPPQSLPPPPPSSLPLRRCSPRLPDSWMLTRTGASTASGTSVGEGTFPAVVNKQNAPSPQGRARGPPVHAGCGLSPGIRRIFPLNLQLLWSKRGAGGVQECGRLSRCQVEENSRGKKKAHTNIGFWTSPELERPQGRRHSSSRS